MLKKLQNFRNKETEIKKMYFDKIGNFNLEF